MNTPRKSFLSHAATYGFGTLLLQASGLVLLPIYVNYLDPAEFGVLDILDQLGSILLIGLMANGFRMATLTFFRQADTEEERQQVSITVSTALFGTVLIGFLLALAGSTRISGWIGLDDQRLFLFGIATGLSEALLIIPLALMQARMQSMRFVRVNVAMFLVRLISLLLLVCVLEWGLWGILFARMISALAFGFWLYFEEFRRSPAMPDAKTFREVFWFSVPFLPGGLLAFFLGFGDRFFLIRESGVYELGLYAMACRLTGFIPAITVGPMYKVWSAMMYDEARKKNADTIFGLMFSRIMFSYVFVGFGLALFAGDLLLVLGGDEYMAALSVLIPLIICGFLGKSADLMDAAFYIERKTKYKPWILAVVGITALLAYYTLIPRYGIAGAAWATAISKAVHLMLTFIISQRLLPVRYEWKRMAIMLISVSVLYGLSLTYSGYTFRFFGDVALVGLMIAISWQLASRKEKEIVLTTVRNRLEQIQKISKVLGLSRKAM